MLNFPVDCNENCNETQNQSLLHSLVFNVAKLCLKACRTRKLHKVQRDIAGVSTQRIPAERMQVILQSSFNFQILPPFLQQCKVYTECHHYTVYLVTAEMVDKTIAVITF